MTLIPGMFILRSTTTGYCSVRNPGVILLMLVSLTAFGQQIPGGAGAHPWREKELLRAGEARQASLLRGTSRASTASTQIDVTYYFLNLRVSTLLADALLSGVVTIQAVNRADSLGQVVLDLMKTLTVDSVSAGGKRTGFSQQPATLTITLDRIYRAGERITLVVTYHGVPSATGFGSFYFSTHAGNTPWVWSLSEPYGSRDWWPCKDHPSDKADSADIWITCDARFKAGSNGTLRSVIDNQDGTRTWRWAERYPIASYLISIAVTDFAEVDYWYRYSATDSMPVVNYVLPELLELAKINLPKTVDMLRIFSDAYGLYPFIREKYGHSSMGSGGAMEHQTMTSTVTFQEYVVAHELAHQWFGDMITCRTWVDLWLNEGFASYSEAVYAERQYGPEAYRGYMRSFFNGARKAAGPLRPIDTTDIGRLFAASGVYDKGASVLHMLRHVVGDTLFFRSLHAYADDPALKYNTASTTDFRRVCETVSGRSLGSFFSQWTDGEGYPAYAYGWSVKPEADSWNLLLLITQTNAAGAATFFSMPLDIRLTGDGWDTTLTVVNTLQSQSYNLTLPRKPLDLRLDPDGWVLAEKTSLNDLTVLPAEFRLYQNYPNPFNPGTTIAFDLPRRLTLTLTVHNVLGEEVARLLDGRVEGGKHVVRWDGTSTTGTRCPSGVYFYYATTEDGTRSGRMILAR